MAAKAGRPPVFNPINAKADGAKAWRKRKDPAQLQAAYEAAVAKTGWDLDTRRQYLVRFVWGWREAMGATLAAQARRAVTKAPIARRASV